jgi:signal recognition particle receptor subunit beta
MPEAERNTLTFKLVYYGPAQSGKTTNLMRLHDLLWPELKGEIMTLETRNDRTLFFDLLPLGFRTASGLLIKFRLFTVPGQVAHDATRKAVLSRSDGVVFVADSQQRQEANNAESFRNLAENAARVGLDFERLPLVVQYNKRDLPDILAESTILDRWSAAQWPLVFACALTGNSVLATFEALLRAVFARFDAECGLTAEHGLSADAFIARASFTVGTVGTIGKQGDRDINQ